MVNETTNKWIYESPDGGATLYRKELGTAEPQDVAGNKDNFTGKSGNCWAPELPKNGEGFNFSYLDDSLATDEPALKTTWIYESPDGGKTLFRRTFDVYDEYGLHKGSNPMWDRESHLLKFIRGGSKKW